MYIKLQKIVDHRVKNIHLNVSFYVNILTQFYISKFANIGKIVKTTYLIVFLNTQICTF